MTFSRRHPRIDHIDAPLFHEDGDMVDIFLDLPEDPSTSILSRNLLLGSTSVKFIVKFIGIVEARCVKQPGVRPLMARVLLESSFP